jgi:hypothetical protein
VAHPPAPRKSRTLLIVLAVLGGIAVLACGVGTLVYLVFVREVEQPITQADRDVLFTVETLSGFADIAADPGRATVKRVRHLDGSSKLTYEYHSPDGAADPLYLTTIVNVERNLSDARTVYVGATFGFKLGLAIEGDASLQQVVKPGLFQWGDESRAVLLMRGDRPVGNVFAGRKGRTVFLMVLAGVFFDDAGQVKAALGPVVQRLEAYAPP